MFLLWGVMFRFAPIILVYDEDDGEPEEEEENKEK